ncbi:uncharacterized protein LOC143290954 [Babylonia areolata]|uniref:uncharacterized protein LOC143290954 n=1 Tax=Babylonia areolata TaxID=304850 RepID=UPI003FCFCB82
MYPGIAAVLIVVVISVADGAVTSVPPRSNSGPGLMRLKDGKPVPLPLPPRPALPTGIRLEQTRMDMKDMAQRYIDELLTKELKHQMDRTKLEKFVTDMLMWRKLMFDRAQA